MHVETTAWICAAMPYSNVCDDDSASGFLSSSGATFRQTVPREHHYNQPFSQDNLVSDDQPGHLNAKVQDPNLINPWGMAFA